MSNIPDFSWHLLPYRKGHKREDAEKLENKPGLLSNFAEAEQVILTFSFAKANKAIQGCQAKAYLP